MKNSLANLCFYAVLMLLIPSLLFCVLVVLFLLLLTVESWESIMNVKLDIRYIDR